ncbi:MAG: glycyl-radical enzyme activating protein [Ruminococcus sp.]|nr:glycyl-radical enzyme activating protein [Ruminococcus sp.]
MVLPYIFNIQKFSVHDGPGIRTTVFFKGCPLRCQWCHNPESQRMEPEVMIGNNQKEKLVGTSYSVRELVKLLKKDQIFYDQSGGGVTLSGGEVMVQNMEYVLELVKALDREGISVVIDTCGFAPTEHFAKLLPYTELFLYDLKMMNDEKHQKHTGVSNELILKNLKYLSDQGTKIELRMIMVKDVNMSSDDILSVAEWLKQEQIKVSKITLLPYHDFGRDKYRQLSRECTQNFDKPTDEELERVKQMLERGGFVVDVHK